MRAARSASLSLLLLTAWVGLAEAAQVQAMDALAGQVVGVVGSGDKLSLELKTDDGPRLIKPGDAYADGWTLQTLSNSAASFAKDGQTRTVGLNPSGLGAQDGDASGATTVTVLGSAADILAQARAKGWDGKPYAGLNQDETQRLIVAQQRAHDVLQARKDASDAARAAGLPDPGAAMTYADFLAAAGQAGLDYRDLGVKTAVARLAPLAAEYQRVGDMTFYVPAGGGLPEVKAAAGYTGLTKLSGPPDAQGGQTYVATAPSMGLVSAIPGPNSTISLVGTGIMTNLR